MRVPGSSATIVARGSSGVVADRERRLWQDLLANTGEWWDNRGDKKSPHLPDFRHKTIREPLWLTSVLKPCWVDAFLLTLHAPMHATSSHPHLFQHGDLDIALHMVLCMEDPPTSHGFYWSLARACSEKSSLSYSKQLFHHLASLKLEAFSLLAEYIVGIFAKHGDAEAAIAAFHVLPYRSAFSWTALIFMYVSCGEPKVALELYQLMQEEKVDPSERTFVALFQACGCAFQLEKGREIHKAAQRAGMAMNAFVGCTLISMYGKCGSIKEALDTFSDMPKHSVVSWTALLSAFLEQGEERDTLQLFKMMREEGVSPNDRTIVVALQACGALITKQVFVSESLEIGRALHSDARRRGYHLDAYVGSSLVTMYGKCGKVLEAENVFVSELDGQNIVSWNAMLSAYLECDLESRVLQLYAWLLKQNFSMNKRTYALLYKLAACLQRRKRQS